MFLTQQERDRFATWCEQEAKDELLLLEQVAKLPGMKVYCERGKLFAAAYDLIAKRLRSIEEG